MATYDVSGKEITYVSWIIEADSEKEAIQKAKEYGAEQAMIGDTELVSVFVAGEYGV